MHDGIRILSRAIEEKIDDSDTYKWLHQFSLGLKLLDDYDHESLDSSGKHTKKIKYPSMSQYLELVNQMRSGFNSTVLGKMKDKSFESKTKVDFKNNLTLSHHKINSFFVKQLF